MTREQHLQAFKTELVKVCMFETLKDYGKRNMAIIALLHYALEIGYKAGIRIDPKEPEWPCIFIELNTGQVSWHIAQHSVEWDGHDTETKYQRIKEYLGDSV